VPRWQVAKCTRTVRPERPREIRSAHVVLRRLLTLEAANQTSFKNELTCTHGRYDWP
jgi:hypothetical protein